LAAEIGTPAKAKTSKSFGVRPNVMWQLSPKWTMAVEGDYVLERLWRNEALARSSATSHVAGGAVYARYQLTQKLGVAARAEYLSDRGGLFQRPNPSSEGDHGHIGLQARRWFLDAL